MTTAEDTAMNDLAKKHGVKTKLKLDEGEFGRGMFAEEDMEPGDVLLQVPLEICILRQLDASDAGLEVEEAATEGHAGKLADGERRKLFWVVELFLTMELVMDMHSQGSFWGEYKKLLPPPDSPLPLLLSAEELDQLRSCDADFVKRVEGHRLKVQDAWQKQTGQVPPPELGWINACVLSRCFHIGQGTSVLAWLAPFVDMINHSYSPNCKVITAGDSIQVVAVDKVKRGAEVFFTYAHFPTAHFFWRYGFFVPDSSFDQLQIPNEAPSLDRGLFAVFLRQEDLLHAPPLKCSAAESIPKRGDGVTEGEDVLVTEEEERAEGLRKIMADAVAACEAYSAADVGPKEVRDYVAERRRLLCEGEGLCARYVDFLRDRRQSTGKGQ